MDENKSKKAVGSFLKAARLDMDVTQADAAKAVGISVPQIKQYEAGNVMPQLITALKFCHFYDVGWDALGEIIANNLGNGGTKKTDGKGDDKCVAEELANTNTPIGPVINLSRTEVRAFGKHIVMDRLVEHGWDVTDVNATRRVQPNFDIKAERGGQIVRLKVTTKKHVSKTTLCIRWDKDLSTFNRNNDGKPADYLVMVRFTNSKDAECFVLNIQEAEKKADWMAEKIQNLGNKPMFLQCYVGRPRKSRFEFNKRKVWEPYSEAWDVLNEAHSS
jgi:transcriptional regulator with XRE-family HTH domain